jgi:hypothetical protein
MKEFDYLKPETNSNFFYGAIKYRLPCRLSSVSQQTDLETSKNKMLYYKKTG